MEHKRTIPEIRARLYELADELGIDELRELANETIRRSPARPRARVKHFPLSFSEKQHIKQYALENPEKHLNEIAEIFNTNPGRISEALHNL